MTKRERLLATLAGATTDRIPYGLWYHFRLDPPAGDAFVEAELDFYWKFDPDFLKVMHDIPYEMPTGIPKIESPADWAKLTVLDGETGNFGRQLAAIRRILAGMGDDGPVVDTVFSIFSTAQKLCGNQTLEHLRADPDAVHAGLRKVAQSLANWSAALIRNGGAGIYLAVSGAASDTMPAEEYRSHFLQYDQQILNAAGGGWFNVLHHHGVGIYPDLMLPLEGYHVYGWSNRLAGNPSVREMRLKRTGCLMAGVNELEFGRMKPEALLAEAKDAMEESGGRAFIVSPGCAVPTPPESPEENLHIFHHAVANL